MAIDLLGIQPHKVSRDLSGYITLSGSNQIPNTYFDYDGGYLINKPSGIDTLSINLSQAKGINQTGAKIQSTNIQPRPVTITGYFVGDMQPEKKEKLISVIRPDLGGKLYADDFYLNVWPTSTPTIEARNQGARFQLSLLAAYPYWCKDECSLMNSI